MAESTPQRHGPSFFKSLTFKVSAMIVCIMMVVLVVLSSVFLVNERDRTLETFNRNAATFARFSARPIYDDYAQFYTHPQEDNFNSFTTRVGEVLSYNRDAENVQLISTSGRLLFDSEEFEGGKYQGAVRTIDDEALLDDINNNEVTTRQVTIDGRNYTQTVVPLVDNNGNHVFAVRYLFSPEAVIAQRMREIYTRVGIVGAGLAVFVAVLSVIISLRITKPIKVLTAATQKIASGDLTQRVPITYGNEYGLLAASFNTMADKLQQVYEGLERRVQEKTAQLAQKVEEVEAEKVKDEALLSSIGEGMVALDADGRVVKINQPAVAMLGLREDSAVGRRVNDAVAFRNDMDKPVSPEDQPGFLALHHGQKTEETYKITRPTGEKISLNVTSSPVRLQHRTVGVIMVVRDVTKEREVDRMKTEFISLASHQLRTPLSAIRWFSEMLISGDAGELTPEQLEFAKNIGDSTDRMIQLVSSLLNISRIESGRIIIDPKPTDLKELVNGIVNDLHAKIAERDQHLAISVHEGLDHINIDPRLIGQVFLNLLTNAIKYTPKGGDISVVISKKGEDVISQVTDNGYGIPKEQQGRMFQKFFRADNVAKVETDGTGLGMYLVKAIIESSGGKIWFESEEGKGTTFWFSLPASGMKAKEGEVSLDS